jgi:hypothetical protein
LRGDAAVPCLFIAGSNDTEILELNEGVLAWLPCEKRLAVVEGAGHLFEGADLAAESFGGHLRPNRLGHPRIRCQGLVSTTA